MDDKMSAPVDGVPLIHDQEWETSAALKRLEIEGVEREGMGGAEGRPSTSSGEGGSNGLPGFAFYLPNLDGLEAGFRTFLEKDLIEAPTQRRLENSRHLNWWNAIGQRLWPLSTTGDGNCLLHAASLGMWGLHDRQLLLRNALYEILIRGSRRSALWRRWRWAESKANEAAGLRLTDDEWATEWRNIVNLAAPTPRKCDDGSSTSSSSDQIYEGLEAFHVFALAHVLKRPIIVVSDTVLRNANGEELSPIAFGGVYLPFECPPDQCHRSPLVLCYDSAHFSPLVSMHHESNLQRIIPITDAGRTLLPLHFSVDPGPDFTWWRDEEDMRMAARLEPTDADRMAFMSEYMDLVLIDVRRGSARRTTPIRREMGTHEKSLSLANTGVSDRIKEDKKRILAEITQQFRRTLRLSSGKGKESVMDVRMCVDALHRNNCVVAARLNAISHEYMEQMATNYIKVARERFHNNKEKATGRGRLGRSFSASSVLMTCINRQCSQPASQATNFFCSSCFERQKALLTSFSSEGGRAIRVLPSNGTPPTTSKSTTMPSLSARLSTSDVKQVEHPAQPVLIDGSGQSTCVSAVVGDDGVTHYFIPDEAPSPQPPPSPAHSNGPDHPTSPARFSSRPISPAHSITTQSLQLAH